MSLSRNQEENNYWPSISDMFLVFFVLTLALASTMIKGQQDGDKFVKDDIIEEARLLVEHINRSEGGDGAASPRITPIDRDEDDMAVVASAMRQARLWLTEKVGAGEAAKRVYIAPEEDAEADADIPTETAAWSAMGHNVKAMYLLLDLGDADTLPDLYYDKMLHRINLKLAEEGGGLSPEQELEATKAQLQEKLKVIAALESRLKQKDSEIARLQKLIAEDDSKSLVNELNRRVKELEEELERKRSLVSSLETDLRNTKGKLVEITENSKISQIVLQESDVTFEHNGTKPKVNPNGHYKELLKLLKDTLAKGDKRYAVEVIGHTDSSGEAKNFGINSFFGMQRANTFIDMLKRDLAATLSPGQMQRVRLLPYSASFHQPIRKANGSIDDAASRRIEVIIRPDKTSAN